MVGENGRWKLDGVGAVVVLGLRVLEPGLSKDEFEGVLVVVDFEGGDSGMVGECDLARPSSRDSEEAAVGKLKCCCRRSQSTQG